MFKRKKLVKNGFSQLARQIEKFEENSIEDEYLRADQLDQERRNHAVRNSGLRGWRNRYLAEYPY